MSGADAAPEPERPANGPTKRGRFQPGQSGNPRGRPPRPELRVFTNLAHEARRYAPMALGVLVELAQRHPTGSVRMNAAIAILDRAYGRPTQSIDLQVDANANVQVSMFADLGLDDPRKLEDDLRHVLDLKAEREAQLDALRPPDTSDEPERDPRPPAAECGPQADP